MRLERLQGVGLRHMSAGGFWSSYLGEQRGPDGLDFVAGSLDDGLQLVGLLRWSLSASLPTSRWNATGSRKWWWVGSGAGLFSYGDLNTLISEDEGGVGRCQLSGRHCECRVVCGLRGARKRSRVSREVVIDCRRCRGWRLVDGVRGGSPPPIFSCDLRCPENLFSAALAGTYLSTRPLVSVGRLGAG